MSDDDRGDQPKQVFHYLLRVLVFQYRMVSYEYFLDGCCIYELNDIVDNVFYTDTNLWESARISNYVLAQINSRSPIEPKELIKFKWDEDVETVKNTEITTEQIKSLKERAKNIKINDFL